MQKSIKHWAEDDRPREKLLLKGSQSLSDAELLAIIIGSGTTSKSALDLAKEILESINHNWHSLSKLSIKDLMKFKGIGEAKAINIWTVLEISRRKDGQNAPQTNKYTTAKDIYQILQPLLGHIEIEEFWILCFNSAYKLIHKQKITQGGITQSIVDIRLVFKIALEKNAIGIIIAHNHPSGQLSPSEPDIQLTNKIHNAAKNLNIDLMDHIIITYDDFYSFRNNNLIN